MKKKSRLKLCKTSDDRILVLRKCKAKKNQTELGLNDLKGDDGTDGGSGDSGTDGGDGSDGNDGSDGDDSTASPFGSGSDGDFSLSNHAIFDAGSGEYTLNTNTAQFENMVITSGTILNVVSGAVLRLSGDFSNAGTIQILPFASGGDCSPFAADSDNSCRPAHPGLAQGASQNGARGTTGNFIAGGSAAIAPESNGNLSIPLLPGPIGGGGGGSSSSAGASGGGTFSILCRGIVSNSGAISANAEASPGGGGGAGGIISIFSGTNITNTGTIEAAGSDGAGSSIARGASGGGSGGLLRLYAPSVSQGTLSVSGGAAGATTTPVTGNPRFGGGGGGSLVSSGGNGGDIQANSLLGDAQAGQLGIIEVDQRDPSTLLSY